MPILTDIASKLGNGTPPAAINEIWTAVGDRFAWHGGGWEIGTIWPASSHTDMPVSADEERVQNQLFGDGHVESKRMSSLTNKHNVFH